MCKNSLADSLVISLLNVQEVRSGVRDRRRSYNSSKLIIGAQASGFLCITTFHLFSRWREVGRGVGISGGSCKSLHTDNQRAS
jgi:hypothetical protein